ncbi:N-acetyltransferase [Campylobacter fetus]|uniref:N-acetyltransferase n=3 Tax=Campylobacter fetus TaxID=196 RepID=A0A5L4IKE9_CAMFE|nr:MULTISPECIES: N-acetyltransferase [Campylobacter]OCS22812.1 acetyltransferase [Campylobacter fetus subsp. venerealis cfvi97/532]OCS26167.1 acetyltransferase [Campylobacter fetus subsp. venerealis cfvB10]OCS29736.1 acetyltransferase [Campylobacter fetus subsp. venerealis LMG 6570 = CCUG 33900]OCS42846.1 acetyltransferase [Campylobacter fetus subsp. venerealis cfvi02/298]ABK83004.1 acetyltransferase, gnat family [Campylobacter fetus subsp. fetus 82-40]
MITYKKAKLKNIPLMQSIVKKEIENGIILSRNDDEIATNIRSYTLAYKDDELVGYSALHIHASNLAEVRSLVIKENLRGQGIGGGLVKELLKEANDLEIEQVFTLTYQKSFFEKLGFNEISKEKLPAQKIWADCIKCKHFPVCNEIALIYYL